MADPVYIDRWSAWAPGVETTEQWSEWSRGERILTASDEKPEIPHVDRMFKRRMSQLTRMAIHVGHEALAGQPPMKISFVSVFGEVARQYKVSLRLLETGEVSPTDFSISVFNTPVASLTVSDTITEGYMAVYTGQEALRQGFLQATAPLVAGAEERRLLIVADELLPETYAEIQPGPNQPYAIALVLTSCPAGGAIAIDPEDPYRGEPDDRELPQALKFLRDTVLK